MCVCTQITLTSNWHRYSNVPFPPTLLHPTQSGDRTNTHNSGTLVPAPVTFAFLLRFLSGFYFYFPSTHSTYTQDASLCHVTPVRVDLQFSPL